MSSNNPDIIASNIITDVEVRLDTPGISTSDYLPWVSYAYQKTYLALARSGQEIKEDLFATLTTFNLSNGTAEYSIKTNIPRFGGFIKVEIKYGASGDDWVVARKIRSISHWKNQNNVSTSYRAKDVALYYKIGDLLGFIPTPPSADTGTPQAKVWYVQRPYQIDAGSDIIDLPYRFIYPISNYVHAKAMERENEDYQISTVIEAKFQADLESVIEEAVSEYNENDGNLGVEVDSNSAIFDDPLGR